MTTDVDRLQGILELARHLYAQDEYDQALQALAGALPRTSGEPLSGVDDHLADGDDGAWVAAGRTRIRRRVLAVARLGVEIEQRARRPSGQSRWAGIVADWSDPADDGPQDDARDDHHLRDGDR